MGGRLIRRTSPSTRIIGGSPAERCKSEAPFLALKASSSVMSMGFGILLSRISQSLKLTAPRKPFNHARRRYAANLDSRTNSGRLRRRRTGPGLGHPAGGEQDPGAAEIAALADQGQRHFGENYLQEALDKMPALAGRELIWHFIGPLQSNKTREVAEHFHWVHSVDRAKVARRLNDQRPEGCRRCRSACR